MTTMNSMPGVPPAPSKPTAKLASILFAGHGRTPIATYAVLDGASIPGLRKRIHQDAPQSCCLYRGELAPDIASVAPYLVRLVPGHPFTEWVLTEGWAAHWGIFIQSAADLAAVRRHFRKFLMIKDPDGKQVYFRFYDPRVLRLFLPTCDAEQLTIMFGPLAAYLCEGPTPETVCHWRFEEQELKAQTLSLAGAAR